VWGAMPGGKRSMASSTESARPKSGDRSCHRHRLLHCWRQCAMATVGVAPGARGAPDDVEEARRVRHRGAGDASMRGKEDPGGSDPDGRGRDDFTSPPKRSLPRHPGGGAGRSTPSATERESPPRRGHRTSTARQARPRGDGRTTAFGSSARRPSPRTAAASSPPRRSRNVRCKAIAPPGERFARLRGPSPPRSR